jgi:SAM-dependent methyltransferase
VTNASTDNLAAVQRQYERWPYPHVPLLALVPSTHPWQLHCDYLFDRCGSGAAPKQPRIWIAGCGTFQPYVFGIANPKADILATDLSEHSLRLAKRRCRVHGLRHVQFAACDLNDPTTWPAGEFDMIECYGVLMNLPNPAATLKALGERLTPRGILRVMVYPQFSRSRIFQLQRLARLCGLHAGERDHPARFRALVRGLHKAHPLRFAFTTYEDSKNDAGVVDGFLHAGDRFFTGLQLGALICGANLTPAMWFHRPWAQPSVMAERLRLTGTSQSFVLHYLDIWQELRTNFIVCLRRADAPPRERGPLRAHPTFSTGGPLRHCLRLQRLRLLGGRVPTRTGQGEIVLSAKHARALATDIERLPDSARARLCADGLLLGGPLPVETLSVQEDLPDNSFATAPLQIGRLAPNPLYAHLFAAFELAQRHPELGLADLELQCARFAPWAEPLEQRPIHFGLTPYKTFQMFRVNVLDHLGRAPLPVAHSFADVRLRNDAACLQQLREWLRHADLPASLPPSDATLRELWSIVFGYQSLFMAIDGA